MTRVCLIVDNPLRDLDGLVLVARTLALRGIDAFLVPMYTQAFDIAAIRPDLVIANYARPNNIDLLKKYRRQGIKVAVLDTEGAGGRNAQEFAALVQRGGAVGNVDLYCCWGRAQFDALRPLLEPVLSLTGCPRYDFCAPRWRSALSAPNVRPGFILINTNFPGVNPRFSSGASNEQRVAVKVGFDESFAQRYLQAATQVIEEIIGLVRDMAGRFPNQHFVLRPHPFEAVERYASLRDLPNFSVQQKGTSLEWVAAASVLVHLNCSTAVEAIMLGKEPVTPAWLDDPVLRVSGPASVSLHPSTLDQLCDTIEICLDGGRPALSPDCLQARSEVIQSSYLAIDGLSAERVADAVDHCLRSDTSSSTRNRPAAKVTAIGIAQRLVGPRIWFGLVDLASRGASRGRRSAKRLSIDRVNDVLGRLARADGGLILSAKPVDDYSAVTGGALVVPAAR